VGCEPTGERLSVVVLNKAEYALLVAKVGSCGMVTANEAFAAADNGGNDFVANLNGVARRIEFNVFTESNNLSGSLVSESYGDKSKGIAAPFVNVGAAYSAALHINENISVLKLWDGEFLDLDRFGSGKCCNLSGLWNRCGFAAGLCAAYLGENFTDNALYL
jgi:hypothetical protein